MAASDGAPPGYRVASPGSLRLSAAFAILTGSALVAMAHEVVVRQSDAYLSPGFGPRLALTTLGAAISAVAGAGAAARAGFDRRALPWLLCSLSMSSTASAFSWFFAFAARDVFSVVAYAVPAWSAALLGAAAWTGLAVVARKARQGEALGPWLAPFSLFALAIGLSALAGLLSVVGLLRSAATLGAVLAALALWCAQSRRALGLSYAALGAAALGFVGAERLVPVAEVRAHPSEIVHALSGKEQRRHVVVAVQRTFELFSDRILRATSLDGHRYAECLTHPGLALAGRRERVLLIGVSDGLVEREVLRYRDVAQLTVVTPDATLQRLADRALWLPGAQPIALDWARLRTVETEPIAWLGSTAESFDVVLADLPDPASYRDGKNFTLYFYEKIAERLAPGGSLVIQATSPHGSPEAFSSIVATLREAGFATAPYAAPVASLGIWGFVLARRDATWPRRLDAEARRVLASLRFLDEERLGTLFRVSPDEWPDPRAPINTLPEQPVVELLHEERARLGL